MKAGQTPCQKYWHKLLDMIQEGKLDPTVVISHEGPLTAAPMLYKLFNDKQDDCVKVRDRLRELCASQKRAQ
jgi:threonine dehydrogenase-like Zn-dependent dehydrogenase